MGRAEPARSFETAVRHLFRHLDDAVALRQNPLVREAFGVTSKGDRATLAAIRVGLTEIAKIEFAAGSVSSSTADGRSLRIVQALCSGASAREIARDMGLSLAQFYRERRSACERVASILLRRQREKLSVATSIDPLLLELNRSTRLAERGLAATACGKLERLFAASSDPSAKVTIALARSDAALQLGRIDWSRTGLDVARMLMQRNDLNEVSRLARHAALVEQHIAAFEGNHELVLEIGRGLVETVARDSNSEADARLDAMILVDWCQFSRFLGNLHDARHALGLAEQLVVRNFPDWVDAKASIAAWRAWTTSSVEADHRLAEHHEALRVSLAADSVTNIISAMIGLSREWLELGDPDRANVYASRALEVARQAEGTITLIDTATSVLPTFFRAQAWSSVAAVFQDLRNAQHPRDIPKAAAARFNYYDGKLLSVTRKWRAALAPLEEAEHTAACLKPARFHVDVLSQLAQALHRCGRLKEGRARIRTAIDIAAEQPDASLLQRTRRIASALQAMA